MPSCFSSKILLFGEHSVIKGSNALAVPYNRFKGCWINPANRAFDDRLVAFCRFLKVKNEDKGTFPRLALDQFEADIRSGLIFSSNIPQGYGLGSSGALTAGVMDRYGQPDHLELSLLKRQLGQMESFFHGASSGTDPLVSLVGKPILILPTGVREVWAPRFSELGSITFFLLDSKQPRQTTPWVNRFLQQYEESDFRDRVDLYLTPLSNRVIDSFLGEQWITFWDSFASLSDWQFQYMQPWIPVSFLNLWQLGLKGNYFKLKLCGAGGGGFLLGITNDWQRFWDTYQRDLICLKIL